MCPTADTTAPMPVAQAAPPAPNTILLTRDGEQELRAKRDALRRQIDVDLPLRLRSAREFGEPADNDDLLQIYEEEAVANARLRALDEVLAGARIVDAEDGSPDIVAIGSTITIKTAGRTIERRVVGAYEAIEGNSVSASSPIGSAMLGRAPGDRIVVELPSGVEQELEIVAVTNSAPAAIAA